MKNVFLVCILVLSVCCFGQKTNRWFRPKIGISAEIVTGTDKLIFIPFYAGFRMDVWRFGLNVTGYRFNAIKNDFIDADNALSYDALFSLNFGKNPKEAGLILLGNYSLNRRNYGVDYAGAPNTGDQSIKNGVEIRNTENGKYLEAFESDDARNDRVFFQKEMPYFGAGIGFKSVQESEIGKGDRTKNVDISLIFNYAPKFASQTAIIDRSLYGINVPVQYQISGLKYRRTGVVMRLNVDLRLIGFQLELGTRPSLYVELPNEKKNFIQKAFVMKFGFHFNLL